MIKEIILQDKFLLELTTDNTTFPLPLFARVPTFFQGINILYETVTVANVLATVFATNSLPPVIVPTFSVEISNSEQQAALLDLQWSSPRIQIAVYTRKNTDDWIRLVVDSCLNTSPYPYNEVILGNYNLGVDYTLGIGLDNVGWGLLDGTDKIIVTGDIFKKVIVFSASSGGGSSGGGNDNNTPNALTDASGNQLSDSNNNILSI
jgi:hypothetical protein